MVNGINSGLDSAQAGSSRGARIVFIAQKNYFSEFLLDWLSQTANVSGVIWVSSERHTWRARVKRLGQRIHRHGLVRAVSELMWFCAVKVIHGRDTRYLKDAIERIRKDQGIVQNHVASISVPSLSDAIVMNFLEERQPDILFAQCINEIIPPAVRSFAELGCYVFHEGILPRYRGKFCTHWAIRNRDYKWIGASVFKAEQVLDGGPVAFTEKVYPQASGYGHRWLGHKTLLLALPRLKMWLDQDVACREIKLRPQKESYSIFSYPTLSNLRGMRRLSAEYDLWRATQHIEIQ